MLLLSGRGHQNLISIYRKRLKTTQSENEVDEISFAFFRNHRRERKRSKKKTNSICIFSLINKWIAKDVGRWMHNITSPLVQPYTCRTFVKLLLLFHHGNGPIDDRIYLLLKLNIIFFVLVIFIFVVIIVNF